MHLQSQNDNRAKKGETGRTTLYCISNHNLKQNNSSECAGKTNRRNSASKRNLLRIYAKRGQKLTQFKGRVLRTFKRKWKKK